jgi:hypothetical protein
MRLRGGLRVLRRGTDEVQIGTDPRWSVRVDGLPRRAVDHLLRQSDQVLDGWLPPGVIDLLGTGGLLHPGGARGRWPAPGSGAEVRVAGLLRPDGDAAGILRRRAVAAVGVVGLDRVGAQVATGLALAGVGTLLLDDDRPVTGEDPGAGVTPADRGSPRADVVARVVRESAPRTRIGRPGGMPPDVVVTVAEEAVDTGRGLALLAADVPHLPVVLRAADALVGPFVEPGLSPCLRCLDLHRADADPAWPVVLAQLTAAARAGRTSCAATAALAAVTGGIVVAEVLAHLDGERPATRGAQYTIALPRAVPVRESWPAHPAGGCADLPA